MCQGGSALAPPTWHDLDVTTDGGAQEPARGADTAARGRGSQRGGGQRGGSSNVQRDHRHKDMHKAAVANHHRKDRALRKQGPPGL